MLKNRGSKLLFIITAVLIVLFLTKDLIIKTIISSSFKSQTGLELSIKRINIGLFKSVADFKDIKVLNPRGFDERVLLNLSQLYVDYNFAALLKKKVHLEELKIILKEFIIVKNKGGELNVNSIKMANKQTGRAQEEERVKGKERPARKPAQVQIDSLQLKIEKVIYKDYSQGTPPKIKEFNVNIDDSFQNITDINSLLKVIAIKAIMKTTISGATDLDVLINGVGSVFKKTRGLTEKTIKDTLDAGKEIGQTTKDILDKTLKKTGDVLEKIFP